MTATLGQAGARVLGPGEGLEPPLSASLVSPVRHGPE